MRKQKTKRCPRCGTKNFYSEFRCTECGLVFSRVENGSNALAKQYIFSHQKDYVVNARMYPSDVSKKKFLLLCGFLGFWGAHNFYVGRFSKAIFQLICGIVSIIMVCFSGVISNYSQIMSFLFLPIGISALMWMFDFADGIFNRYKIPVAVNFAEGEKLKND